MWEISVADQSVTFLLSIVLGAILCLLYDVFRSMRKAKQYSAVAVFFQDIAFFIVSAFVVFIFLLATTAGVIRAYILIGIFIGAVLMRLTLSRIIYIFLVYVFKLLIRYLGAFRDEFYHTGDRISIIFYKLIIKIISSLKKFLFFIKKGLKHKGELVYTNGEEIEKE